MTNDEIKIYLGADHAGYELKEKIKNWIEEWGYEYEDKGAYEYNKDDDYPDFVNQVARAVSEDAENHLGIVIGGSGQGEAMAANRHTGVRAAVFYGPRTPEKEADITGRESDDSYEIVKLSKEHNNANVLSLAARFLTEEEAKKAVQLWLKTPFSGEERHIRRINKIN